MYYNKVILVLVLYNTVYNPSQCIICTAVVKDTIELFIQLQLYNTSIRYKV